MMDLLSAVVNKLDSLQQPAAAPQPAPDPTAGAKDVLSLMFLMLDQAAQDAGDYSLAWLLTPQADPPAGVFQEPSHLPGSALQTFSALAEQRWVTTSLACVKELETIAQRRSEAAPKSKLPPKPAPPPAPPTSDQSEAALSKKQQRAAAWAAKKAAVAKK